MEKKSNYQEVNWLESTLIVPLSLEDCLVIIMEGKYWRNPALAGLGSSALECGHLELWVIELPANAIFSLACSPAADR